MVATANTNVSDIDRYRLALQAGFTGQDAVTATAISIAENGSGNPSLPSGKNKNGTFDLGLWQINSSWFNLFGGETALTDPLTNAKAAFAVFQRQGFNAWCTFWPSGCGGANANDPAVQRNWQSAVQRANAAVGNITTPTDTTQPVTTDTTTSATTGTQTTASVGSNPSQSISTNLNLADSIQHTIIQFLLVLIGLALLLGGIYLLGSKR